MLPSPGERRWQSLNGAPEGDDTGNRQHLPLYVIALAILIVGLVSAGVPVQTILFSLLVLACPLMMFMMGGHGGPDQR